MLKRFGQKLSDILFHSFSELELITLFYIIILLIIEQRSSLILFINDQFTLALQISDSFERFKALASWTVAIIFVVIFFVMLVVHALKNKLVNVYERESFSFFFYTLLSAISLISAFEILFTISGEGLYAKFEEISILFLLIRSFFTLVLTFIFSKQGRDYIYSSKMTDEQLNKKELVLLILLSTVTYIILRGNHSIPTALSLSYFYVTTAVLFFRKLAGNQIIIR